MSRVLVAVVIAVASIGVFIVAPVVGPTDPTAVVLFGAATASAVLVGLLLVLRAPGNRIGGLLIATGGLLATAFGLSVYLAVATLETPPWPGIAVAGLVDDFLFILPIVFALILIPLMFPDGHLPSKRWRVFIWLLVLALTAQAFAAFVGPATVGQSGVANPFYVPALAPLASGLGEFANVTSIIGFGGAAAAVWVRYRRGDAIERQQLKWFLVAPAVAAVAFPMAFIVKIQPLADAAFAVGLLTLVALPLAIGVAVLRYRLYEIDRIISRTLSYAIVTGVLGAVFVGVILVLQAVFVGVLGRGGIPVAISTLAVFALFQPVLRRVRRVVDKRFDRARYDAELTAAAFGNRLRNEVDLTAVTTDLAATATAALAPATLGVWIRESAR